ncbi:S-adenosyl-L-methionine-dependent methyltransferase [Aspergillus egyptiacus]|nr:S-adenosyl-L-methionine-dependent methyltransferase [Aspergillus egyptiacus]
MEHDPIVLSGDEYASDASSETLDHDTSRIASPGPSNSPSLNETIDLTGSAALSESEDSSDECFEVPCDHWNAIIHAARTQAPEELRPARQLEEFCLDGIVYKAGQSVQLFDDTFLRIRSVWEEPKGAIFFKGRRLISTKAHDGTYIPKWDNELVWISNEETDIPLAIVRRFVSIHFTNHCHTSRDPKKASQGDHLFCRLKEVLERNKTSVEYLTYDEADIGYRVASKSLRWEWRGSTSPFGSEARTNPPVIVLDEDDDHHRHESDLTRDQKMRRKYTFGDGFCGAGGVSCGAEMAGLSVKWAFDLSPHAIATYSLNFPMADRHISDAYHFFLNNEEGLRVDVTHGSPPCQTFSPAHTIPSANDDNNSACIFSCGNLIRKIRPRIHTMEETSGLSERHKETLHAVIHDFLETGFSVRWAVLKCMDYGVPQLRKRLIIIASGPGETLPALPKPTHGPPSSGLQEIVTINQAIANIPPGTPDHDIEGAQSRGYQREPFDGDTQARTITCGGGENNYHPSGRRLYTNRELACLQTFPIDFKFGRREVRKQIGNAVPPLLAKAIYVEIIKSLQETDEREMGENRETTDDGHMLCEVYS